MAFTEKQIKWCEAHHEEALEILRELGRIPAPSHNEDRRCEYVLELLRRWGFEGAYIDAAKNVVFPVNVQEDNDIVVIMAHTDIVFPDTEALPLREEDGRIYAPGIGDDTANLVNLLMCAKYILETGSKPSCGVLFAANSCEEGLGNLKGSKQIVGAYGKRIREFISFDGYMGSVTDNAVGSCRLRITVKAQGGHSYSAFGNTNAIVQMADIIRRLYEKQVPERAKTTYNAGVIEGGTTVNSICGECRLLYEYRSEDAGCLREMEDYFLSVMDEFRAKGYDITVETLGIRPCRGDVDPARQQALNARVVDIMRRYKGAEPVFRAMSTDANTSLAAGIPSVVIGTVDGGKCHTREEWIDTASMLPGSMAALETVLHYFGD